MKIIRRYESARQYAFSTVLKNKLYSAFTAELKQRKSKKRMPDGGIMSLDYTLEGDNPFAEYTCKELETYWIDQRQQVERVVLDRELFAEILMELNTIQGKIFEMLLEGYKKAEIKRFLNISSASLNEEMEWIKKIIYMCMA